MLEDSRTELSDEVLLKAVRAGEEGAYGTLYERYRSTAQAIAYKHTSDPGTVDDIVAEAFARILQALRNGNGPTTFMGGYLSTTIAHLAGEFGLIRGREVPADSESLENLATFDETVLQLKDSDELIKAFTSMPERWQSVLWLTEVEERKPREIATVLDLTPNAVSALAVRARESLREGFLRAHQSAPQTDQCQKYFDYLPALVRDSLSERRTQQVREHLEDCTYCTSEYLSLLGINKSMRVWVFPVLAGLVPWTTDGATILSFISKTAVAGTLGGASLHTSSTSAPGLSASSRQAATGASASHSTGSALAGSKTFVISRPSTWSSAAGTSPLAIAGGGALALAAVVGGISMGIDNFAEEPVNSSADFGRSEASAAPDSKSSTNDSKSGTSAEAQRTMGGSMEATSSSDEAAANSNRPSSLALAGLGWGANDNSVANSSNGSATDANAGLLQSFDQASEGASVASSLPLAGGALFGVSSDSENSNATVGQEPVTADSNSSAPLNATHATGENGSASRDAQNQQPAENSDGFTPAQPEEENQPEPVVTPNTPDPVEPTPHEEPVGPEPIDDQPEPIDQAPAPIDDPADPEPVPVPVDPDPAEDPVAPGPVDPAPVVDPVDPEPVPAPVDPDPAEDPVAPGPVDPAPVVDPVDPAPVVDPIDPAPVPDPENGEDRGVPAPDPVEDDRQVPKKIKDPAAFKRWVASFSVRDFETPDPATHYFVSYRYSENGQQYTGGKWLPKGFVDNRWFYSGMEYLYGYDKMLDAEIMWNENPTP